MIAAQVNEKIQAITEAKATPPIPINFKSIIERNKLRKDIVSHTTFVDGPKPKGAFDLKGLEELAMKIVEMKIRQIKDIPKVYTGFVNDYAREVVYPRARKMMEEDDSLTKKEAIKRAFNRREYIKYAMSKNVDSILNR